MIKALLIVAVISLCAAPSSAAPADAREVARMNNCSPKKVEVYQQQLGGDAPTIYRVECIAPKVVGQNVPTMPTMMLVRCTGSLCEMLRPITTNATSQ